MSESEYVGTSLLREKQFVTQLIYSKEKEIVEQQQYIFNTFWKNSLPADIKIKEIEQGIQPTKTEIIEDEIDISQRIVELAGKSNEMSISCTIGGMHLIKKNYFELYKEVAKRQREGIHKGIRWIVPINNNNDIRLVKCFLDLGIRVRHVNYLPQPSFALSDKLLNSTIEKMEGGEKVTNLLSSNDPLYLNHYKMIFEEVWKAGSNAEERIKDLEAGYYTNTKIIPHPKESMNLLLELMKFVKKEVLVVVPSEKGLSRIESVEGLKVLDELALKGITVKVLHIETDDKNYILKNIKSNNPHIEFRSLKTSFQPLIRITVIDREKTMLMEIKEDVSDNFLTALGTSLLIENKSTALSYALIFENLWNESEMFEKLQAAYKKLELTEKMQKEFIDIVAHELRTPLTPITGLTQIVRDELKDIRQTDLLDIVIESSKKLQTLTEKILDVTRIEGKLFKIQKEKFNLNQLISEIVKDFENTLNDKNDIQIKFIIDIKHNINFIVVNADKTKIRQVISNLIENAIKFISEKQKTICITIERKEIHDDGNDDNLKKFIAVVSVIDNGKGIDPDILSRLFTKFASRSFQGTGLGLYLSKNIVEAHGGNIWGRNNDDGKGATFSFNLPSDK